MKTKILNRALSLLLALVCVLGVLPLSAFAAGLSSAPGSITQKSSDYMKIGGRSVRYQAASSVINNVGLPYVFDEQVEVPGYGTTRALCAYQKGTLGPGANGQKWNFKEEVNNASLRVLLTYIYSHTYGDFTDMGNAIGLEHWNNYWSDIWFMVGQAMSWYYEHGIIKDVNSDREGFIEQASEEFVAAMKLYHRTYGQSSFITNWDAIGTHSIIDSADGGQTGNSAYDYISTGVNLVMDHPEYFHNYHLWMYDWDKSQPWKLAGQSGVPMQRLLIAVPDQEYEEPGVRLTVKKLEAGTNKPLERLIHDIKFPGHGKRTEYEAVSRYNSYVIGVHNYYSMATMVCDDLSFTAFSVQKSLRARMGKRLKTAKQVRKRKLNYVIPDYIKVRYGKSEQLRYVDGYALAPIGYVKHRNPMHKRRIVNSYTLEGRGAIHKALGKNINTVIMHYLMRNPIPYRSTAYNDNRISLYCAQFGKCAVTGEMLNIGDIHCHHKLPRYLGGTDEYKNLVIVCENIHRLIHATNPETIRKYMEKLKLTPKQLKKLEKLRSLAHVESCLQFDAI